MLGPSLEGDWEGEIDCGEAGTADLKLELERDEGNEYVGEGEIKNYGCQGCELTFEIEIEADGGFGEQELDLDADDCVYTSPYGTEDVTCDNDFDEVIWDGKDTIEFENGSCDGELERD